MPLPIQSPDYYAALAVRLTKADQCDTREFDDCFEMGNLGPQVIAKFVALYKKDRTLQQAVLRNDEFINITQWEKTAEQVNNPLFAA